MSPTASASSVRHLRGRASVLDSRGLKHDGGRVTPDNRAAEVASQVAELARSVLGDRVRVLWFGSWPQARAVRGSDIDIALEADGPIPPAVFARLREAVEDLPTLHSVDLVDLRLADRRLREEILAHGVPL